MTRDEMIALLKFASVHFEIAISKPVIDGWFFSLGHLSFPVAKAAFQRVSQTLDYPRIRPAHVVKAANELIGQRNRNLDPGQAWEIIRKIPSGYSEDQARAAICDKCPEAYEALTHTYGIDPFRSLVMDDLNYLALRQKTFFQMFREVIERKEAKSITDRFRLSAGTEQKQIETQGGA